MGCISRLSPRVSYARSCLFIVPNIFGFSLDAVERLSSPLSSAQPNLPSTASIASDLQAQPIYIPLHPFYPFYARRFPVSRVPIPTICLVLAGSSITSALWGAFRGFPREYLTPAHVCLLSRILFGYPCAPRTQPRRSRPNNTVIFSENSNFICIYAKKAVTLQVEYENQ